MGLQHRTRAALSARMLRCILLLCMAAAATARPAKRTAPFLQRELPLTITVTTPTKLKSSSTDPVEVFGNQAITVVFSRPVIALGSDFGEGSAVGKFPFRLSCAALPGRGRWVTTSIARWEPAGAWPPDTDCSLAWERGLTAYDGATLQLKGIAPSRRLVTAPLRMWLAGVTSESAANLTGGLWDPNLGASWEVPPDGKIEVSFSSPVNLAMVKAALQVVEARAASAAPLAFDLAPCQSPVPGVTLSLDVNATCAEVSMRTLLKASTGYLLRLPAGSRYHALSGPLGAEAAAPFSGLRPFRIDFTQGLGEGEDPRYSGIRYRRLDLWLPHGLAPATPPAALAARIQLCRLADPASPASACAPEPFAVPLPLPARGKLRLRVPGLAPGAKYRITVAADSGVRDGYGLPLQASSTAFWTPYVDYALASPGLAGALAVIEPGVEPLSAWPAAAHPPAPVSPGWQPWWGQPAYASRLEAWEVDVADEAAVAGLLRLALQGQYGSINPAALFGAPAASVALPRELSTPGSAAGWSRLELPLSPSRPGAGTLRLITACCDANGNPTEARLLLNSSLSASVVQLGATLTAWVTDGGAAGGPVAGAAVSVYLLSYSEGGPVKEGECVTGEDGTCGIAGRGPRTSYDGQYVAVVSGGPGGGAALIPQAGSAQPAAAPPPYTASLVLDRAAVAPGDSIKVTGFVQRASPKGLQTPPAAYAVLEVSPPWVDASSPSPFDDPVSPTGGLPFPIPSVKAGITSADAVSSVGTSSVGFSSDAAVASSSSSSFAADAVSFGSTMTVSSMGAASAAAVPGFEGPYGNGGIAEAAVAVTAADMPIRAEPMPILVDSISGGGWAGGLPGGGGGVPSSSAVERYVVRLDGESGTLHAEIPVPPAAGLRPYTVTLRLSSDPEADAASSAEAEPGAAETAGWPVVAAAGFVAADPRPPTVELKLEAPAWVRPDATVNVSLTAVSYIGASVGGARITLTWSHAGGSGVRELVTDAAGAAATALDLRAEAEAQGGAVAAGSLSLRAEWVGPTRERITREASVIIADGPASLSLELSHPAEVPGTAFAVSAALTSNEDGSEIKGVPVAVTLTPLPGESVGCAEAPSCTTASGRGFDALCQLALPCVGRFVLRACTAGPGPQPACANLTLGRSASEWAAAPWAAHKAPLTIRTDKPAYRPGDAPVLSLQSPWPHARLLLVWGNNWGQAAAVRELPANTLTEVALPPLGSECTGGCALQAVLHVPRTARADYAAPPPADLPTSRLFDPYAPHTHFAALRLDVQPDNALQVAVAVEGAEGSALGTVTDADGNALLVIEPGAEAQITVTVSGGADGAPLPDGAEVTVYGVDAAWLALLPYGLPRPQYDMLLRLPADVAAYGMDAYRLAPGAVRAVYDRLMARLTGQDPWLPADTYVGKRSEYGYPYYGAGSGAAAVDTPDEAYLAAFASSLTPMPSSYSRYPVAPCASCVQKDESMATVMPMPQPGATEDVGAGAGSGGGGAGAPAAVVGPLRSAAAALVTPLFETVRTDAAGRATVTFKAPQNLGTFEIRAFAAAGSAAKYGSGSAELVVRRRLSLTAALPRFVRVGDVFQAGVVVTVGAAPATVAVTLTVSDPDASPLAATDEALTRTVTFAAGDDLEQEVRFSFAAAAVGTARLAFSAADTQPGGGADGLEVELPVEGQQGAVWIATSFALAAGGEGAGGAGQRAEGMELPDAVEGSGSLVLTAGVGHYPSIAATYDSLLQEEANRAHPEAHPALLWATLPALLSYYAQPPSTAQSAEVSAAFSDLASLTSPALGLQWTLPSRFAGWVPDRADIGLNAWALVLAAAHADALAGGGDSLPEGLAALAPGWGGVSGSLAPVWRAAAGRQLVADAEEARAGRWGPPRAYDDWRSLAWARLALGGGWDPAAAGASDQAARDLSLDALAAGVAQADLQTRLLAVLALLGAGEGAHPLVAATVEEAVSGLRTQGRTAYVAASAGSAAAAPLDSQALALLLLLRTNGAEAAGELLPKLAAHVANPTPPAAGGGRFCAPPSWAAAGLAAAALAEYDRAAGSADPDLDLVATANGMTVLEASFQTGNTAPVINATAWGDIPPVRGTGSLTFQALGRGEVSAVASARFVPAALLAFPAYRGLYVEGALRAVDPATGRPTGRPLSGVPLGSMVAYTLQLTSPDDLGPVTLSVLMPGGLEPLDPNLVPDAGPACEVQSLGDVDFGAFYGRSWWWWPVCPAQETRPSVVTFRYASLRAGTSSVTVTAVAATAGTWVLPPVVAAADAQPELSGSTAAGALTVCAACAGPTYGSAPPPPKPCPKGCSGSGVCNLKTGRCLCNAGYSGRDCSKPVE